MFIFWSGPNRLKDKIEASPARYDSSTIDAGQLAKNVGKGFFVAGVVAGQAALITVKAAGKVGKLALRATVPPCVADRNDITGW